MDEKQILLLVKLSKNMALQKNITTSATKKSTTDGCGYAPHCLVFICGQ
jgi:hypothetical protein